MSFIVKYTTHFCSYSMARDVDEEHEENTADYITADNISLKFRKADMDDNIVEFKNTMGVGEEEVEFKQKRHIKS